MYHIPKLISPLNTSVHDYFNLHKEDILYITTRQWNDEDLKGETLRQWKIMQYYYFMYFLILLYEEIERTKDLGYSWDYYADKFSIEAIKKCITCDNIAWDKSLEAFNIPYNFITQGIEFLGIEESLHITGNELPKSSKTIQELINTPSSCQYLYE